MSRLRASPPVPLFSSAAGRRALVWPAILLFCIAIFSYGEGSELKCDPSCVHGECTAYLGNLSCQCIGNWSGDNCSTFICDKENPCENGGTCSYAEDDPSKFLCSCPVPFFGDICQYTVEEFPGVLGSCEVGDPCNGSSCYNLVNGTGHVCYCQPGWWGVGCNHTICTMDPYHLCLPRDRCQDPEFSCHGHGVCIWDESVPSFHSGCKCDPGWDNSHDCELVNGRNAMFCRYTPCGDFGNCSHVLPDVYDPNDYDIQHIDYFCTCDGTHQGKNCSEPFDICNPNPCVSGTCSPTHEGHYFECTCPPGRRGDRCENYDNPCDTHVCQNGGNCTTDVHPYPDGSYSAPGATCTCCQGFSGSHCEITSDNHTLCRPNPCKSGGECQLLSSDAYKCNCPNEFTGLNCELDVCPQNPPYCDPEHNNGCFVVNENNDPLCICKEGWGGLRCDEDIDECLAAAGLTLCHNHGTCVNEPGGYSCSCTPEYTGSECKEYLPQPVNCSLESQSCLNGGTCVDQNGTSVCECTRGFKGKTCQLVACQNENCPNLATNGECDMECFTEECDFDGGEGYCFPDNDPWQNCTNPSCRGNAANGMCNPECNTRVCLFDSYECVPSPPLCPASQIEFCLNKTDDGICEESCNTAACPFDSKDCDTREYIKDKLVVYVLGQASGENFKDNEKLKREFKEAVGVITNTNPVIEDIDLLSVEEGRKENIVVPEGKYLYRVTLKLDLEYCSDQCIESVEEAVNFMNAYYASGQSIAGLGYVRSEGQSDEPDTQDENPGTVTTVVVTLIIVLVLGSFIGAGVLMVGKKRKVIRAKIFYPGQSQVDDSAHDRSPPNKRRKVAQNDLTTTNLVNSTEDSSISASTSGEYIREGSKAAKMDSSGKVITWADFRVPIGDSPGHDPSDVAVVSQVGNDHRKWNYLHYSAVRNPEIMRGLLEKCRGDDTKKWDVNTPGPGGYTPLMLAVTQKTIDGFPITSRSSSSSDSSGEHAEHNGLLISPTTKTIQLVPRSDTSSPSGSSFLGSPLNSTVDALLGARVKLDATNDYGRTALHLAAVCARGDYVKKLLGVGANPNVQDNWGQSALHAAIGAAAEGAFQMLLDYPKTDINLKSDGGITPLMEAVKTTNMYMVKQLVKKNADISLTDYEGRTAVHWAAMTENVEALKLLIRQGPDTIKDTQDNKGQTALFLACREGATECARHLLDVFANATLLDNLDRSPLNIAFERQHLYIIEMLKSHGPYHYQLPASGGRHAHSVPHHLQMMQQQQEMALRQHQLVAAQQQQQAVGYSSAAGYNPHHPATSHHQEMMVEMQQMPPTLEHYPGHDLQPAPRGQTFGDLGYPTTSSMDMGHPGSASYKPLNTFFTNSMQQQHTAENGGVNTPTVAAPPQHFYPPSTTSQLPVSSAEHPSPPSTYHQHASPPLQPLQQQQPTTTSDLPAFSSCPGIDPTTSYPTYPAVSSSGGHFPVTSVTSDSEQRMVSELITSISDSSPAQPLQSPPQQQPHSASSVHSNRSPSALYPSPPNSETLQHSSEVAQQNGMTTVPYHPHASPPSLTPSPESREDSTQHNITTIEGLVQQHDYPSVLYGGGGGDSFNYGGIRFTQDYSTETTV